jgi:cytochrome c554/c'-like protein
MQVRFRDVEHVLRIGVIFVVAVAAFLVWRSWMVPPDFGKYGHFRAGALEDGMRRPVVYAGQAACVDCHSDVAELRKAGRHAHVACEACHGPLSQHAVGEGDKPVRPQALKLCPVCHAAGQGKPKTFPQVVVQDHMGDTACTECHKAHSPHIS